MLPKKKKETKALLSQCLTFFFLIGLNISLRFFFFFKSHDSVHLAFHCSLLVWVKAKVTPIMISSTCTSACWSASFPFMSSIPSSPVTSTFRGELWQANISTKGTSVTHDYIAAQRIAVDMKDLLIMQNKRCILHTV